MLCLGCRFRERQCQNKRGKKEEKKEDEDEEEEQQTSAGGEGDRVLPAWAATTDVDAHSALGDKIEVR